jgi:hypothetical protein
MRANHGVIVEDISSNEALTEQLYIYSPCDSNIADSISIKVASASLQPFASSAIFFNVSITASSFPTGTKR